MKVLFAKRFWWSFVRLKFAARIAAVPIAGTIVVSTATSSLADEGGVSFWVPGFFGSLAAAPQVPGFSFANVLYYSQVSAGGNVAFAKQVPLGNINVNFNGNFNANVHGSAEPLYLAVPGYTFATPVLGGQANISAAIPYGRIQSSVDATIAGNLGLGGPGFTIGRGLTEAVTGIGDIAPMASLRWNFGVNNFMTYLTGNLTTGRYSQTRIANTGIGHNAIDGGGSYTYFDQKTGREFSATLGFTYNFENEHTNYQNGIDMHLDWGASQFLTKQWQVGTRWLFIRSIVVRQRLRRPRRLLRVTRGRHWTADRLCHSNQQRMAGIHQPQGLRGIRLAEPSRRLERLADVCHLHRRLPGRRLRQPRVA